MEIKYRISRKQHRIQRFDEEHSSLGAIKGAETETNRLRMGLGQRCSMKKSSRVSISRTHIGPTLNTHNVILKWESKTSDGLTKTP